VVRVRTLLRLALALSLIALLAVPLAPYTLVAQAQAAATKGPAVDRVEWFRVPIEGAEAAITAGKIDLYMFGRLSPEVAARLAATPGVRVIAAPAGLTDIILNPAPVQILKLPGRLDKDAVAGRLGVNPVIVRYVKYLPDENKTEAELCAAVTPPSGVEEVFRSDKFNFNPFCIREIRYVLNYVFDRERLLREVYRGFATIKYIFYGPDDPTYTELFDLIAKYAFPYDFVTARNEITRIMTAAGAELIDGKWHYKGKRIDIIGIVRIEDERLLLGEAFASELSRLGFNVITVRTDFSVAIPKVYGTNPIDFEWFFYTEGWGKGVLDRWDAGLLAQFGADIIGYLPGWLEPEYWNYKHELTIDGKNASDYARAAYFMEVKSKEEWVDALRKGTELAILESVRIWGFATHDRWPVRADVKGLTVDLGAGLRSPYNCRGWYVEGRTDIKVGHLWVFTAATAWNTYGGFTDVYSVDPARCTYDFVVWRHPFNGMPIPFRASFTVETAGPDGKLKVPDDAIWFDAAKGKWVYARELGRVEATSKVVFDLSKFLGAKWHNGQTITWADLLGSLALYLDAIYNPEKSRIERAYASQWRPFYDTVVAIRPVGNSLEVYVDFWHFEPAYIADWATLATTTTLPFELVAAQDFVAFVTKERALTLTRTRAEGIPWLSLALDRDATPIASYFKEGKISFEDYKKYITMPDGKTLMTVDEWRARIPALLAWFERTKNLWISNGPYMLTYYSSVEQKLVLEAFRDPTYPFGPKDWVWGEARPTIIREAIAPLVPVGGSARVIVTAIGVGEVTVKYVMRDPETKEVLLSGFAEHIGPATFAITIPESITSKLTPYKIYEILVLAYSSEVVLPVETVVRVQTVELIAPVKEAVEELNKRLEDTQKALSENIEAVRKQLSEEMAKGLTALSDALSKSIRDLSTATTEAIRILGSEVGRQISDLRSSTEASINAVETSLSKQINTASETARSAESNARLALIVSVINLLILLGIAALVFMRRS